MTCSRAVLRSAGILALGMLVLLRPAHSQQHARSGGGIEFGDDSGQWAKDGECDDPRFEGEGSANTLVVTDQYHDATDCQSLLGEGRVRFRMDIAIGSTAVTAAHAGRVERGHLGDGDPVLKSREFADTYEFEGVPGGRAIIDLRSGEFDPYLLVRAPSGAQFDNDDYEGDSKRSLLALDLKESGTYRVIVTSYAEGETGSYSVAINVDAGQATAGRIDRSGSLKKGDEKMKSGEFVDAYEFEGSAGQPVSIDLTSSAFDTYLILRLPSGEQIENDDADDVTGHSSIEADITQSGTYRVLVTSYGAGETGDYHLTIAPSAGDRTRMTRRDVRTLTAGRAKDELAEDGYQHLPIDRGRIGPFDVPLATR